MDDGRTERTSDGGNAPVVLPPIVCGLCIFGVTVRMKASREKLCVGLTDAGKTVLQGTCFVALAALIVPAFGVLSALVSVMLMSLLVGYVLRPRIQLSGNLPDRVIAGQTTRLRYVLKNVARVPAYNFSVRLPALPDAIEQIGGEQMVRRLGPGETTEVTIPIGAGRRGHYQIQQPVCESSFPFNLLSFATTRDQAETLIVLPVFSRLQFSVRDLSRHVSTAGTRLAGLTGAFPEYAGNRPFVTGDSARTIDARAWARLSVPATKEYHDDFDNHTALVLDTDAGGLASRSGSKEIPQLEAAISLCASVAHTINNHCLIDMLLAGLDLHTFDGWPRRARLDKTHEILAGIEPQEGYDLEQTLPMLAERFSRISEVIFVLLHYSKQYQHLVEEVQRAGCHSTVLVIGASGQLDRDPNIANQATNVRVLSPEEILTEQTVRL
ncbi:MAG: hypothetical protein AMJ65_04255 [Phycisphaerae bacterium SG8_4]|nr:MAG: hypothetical protein AMJ65_04255 [Phycisphaerae bacterium SG8_4]